MFAGFVIGLSVGLFISVFVYMYMDASQYRQCHERKCKCQNLN